MNTRKNILIVLLICVLLLTGCGKSNNTNENKENNNTNNASIDYSNISVIHEKTIELSDELYKKYLDSEEYKGLYRDDLSIWFDADCKDIMSDYLYAFEYYEQGGWDDYNYNQPIYKYPHSNYEECNSNEIGCGLSGSRLKEVPKIAEGIGEKLNACMKKKYDAYNEGYDRPEYVNQHDYHRLNRVEYYVDVKNTTYDKEKDFIEKMYINALVGITKPDSQYKNKSYYNGIKIGDNDYNDYLRIYPITYKGRLIDYKIYFDVVKKGVDYESKRNELDEKYKKYYNSYLDDYGLYKGETVKDNDTNSFYDAEITDMEYELISPYTYDHLYAKGYDTYEYLKNHNSYEYLMKIQEYKDKEDKTYYWWEHE